MTSFSYTTGNPSNLTGGASASMNDIQGPFTDIRTYINGANLDYGNLSPLVGVDYTHILGVGADMAALTAATFLLPRHFHAASPGASAPGVPTTLQIYAFRLDPADYALSGRTAKYRLKASVDVNVVAPTVNFTFGLYPASVGFGSSGASNYVTSVGAVTAGSTVAFVAPGASSSTASTSGDFSAPASGLFAIGVAVSGSQAANSHVNAIVELQRRTV